MLFLTLDKVLSWWCMLLFFISNNWRSVKYIIQKAWSYSQNGVGKLYCWLYAWAEFGSRDKQRPANICVIAQTYTTEYYSPAHGAEHACWSHPWDSSHSHCRSVNRGITSVDDIEIISSCVYVVYLPISSFLPQTAHQLQAVLWCAAPHWGIRSPAPPAK